VSDPWSSKLSANGGGRCGDRSFDPSFLRGIEVLELPALQPLEALLIDGDALGADAMDRALVAEPRAVTATSLAGRSRRWAGARHLILGHSPEH
jgi:hypothetical protein